MKIITLVMNQNLILVHRLQARGLLPVQHAGHFKHLYTLWFFQWINYRFSYIINSPSAQSFGFLFSPVTTRKCFSS